MEIQDIIKAAGGLTKLASAVGRHHTSVYGWRRVPAEHVPVVSRHTGIPRHVLRPDLYEAPSKDAA